MTHAQMVGADNQTLDDWAAKARASLDGFIAAMRETAWVQSKSERDLVEIFGMGVTMAPRDWPAFLAKMDEDGLD